VAGVADELRHGGVAVFGPGRGAARIEGSKAFAKDVMQAAGVPTAEALPVARVPCVIKADGLAAGKGVYICRTGTELEDGLRNATGFGGSVVIEELLEGREASLFAICDGARALPLAPAQDYSRASDGDDGAEHGRHGVVLHPYRGSALNRSTSWSRRCTSPCCGSSPRAGRRSSASSTPA